MTVTQFRLRAWWVKEWRCCGLVWQVVNANLQGRYFHRKRTCPQCGAEEQ